MFWHLLANSCGWICRRVTRFGPAAANSDSHSAAARGSPAGIAQLHHVVHGHLHEVIAGGFEFEVAEDRDGDR